MIDLRGSRFTDITPENLSSQLETRAFAYALGRQIEKLCAYADGVHIYAAVASMPEKILDILAVELRTPAYNQKFSIEVKRALVEGTLAFYAHMGTPAACNRIIEIIFGAGYIEEWFDYGGEPHHFRAFVGNSGEGVTLESLDEFIRAVASVKRLSSWLDEIIITICFPPASLHVGGGVGTSVHIGIAERTEHFDFQHTIRTGTVFSAHVSVPVLEDPTPPSATTILRTGGVFTIISNLSEGK